MAVTVNEFVPLELEGEVTLIIVDPEDPADMLRLLLSRTHVHPDGQFGVSEKLELPQLELSWFVTVTL